MYSVLIVEDELNVCRGLSVLVDWEALGFHISGFVGDGLSAQRQLEMEKYDLLLCDIHIPGMNGTGADSLAARGESAHRGHHHQRLSGF